MMMDINDMMEMMMMMMELMVTNNATCSGCTMVHLHLGLQTPIFGSSCDLDLSQ